VQPNTSSAIVELIDVSRFFGSFQALREVSLSVSKGERMVICGPSGSGKSTLIRCVNQLEKHDAGKVIVNGVELGPDKKQLREVRTDVGMVFQQFNLFPHLSVLENLLLGPMRARKLDRNEATKLAMHYLERVRIPEQADKYPRQLSGGQQQRVAIARALAAKPMLLLADEPTGNLDEATAEDVLTQLLVLVAQTGAALMVVTHSPKLAARMERQLHLHGGQLT